MPLRMRVQYVLSCSYFLAGWTVLAYMTFPIVRILTGEQPLAAPAADQFLLHFAPYFGLALSMVAMMGSGAYTFRAFALQSASFWIHVHASLLALLRRPGSFKVTPKRGAAGRQPRAVLPSLAAAMALLSVAVVGLAVLALSQGAAWPQEKSGDITLQVVKYDGLAEAVTRNRGKVIVIDFWQFT